jgi:hypothetical protein
VIAITGRSGEPPATAVIAAPQEQIEKGFLDFDVAIATPDLYCQVESAVRFDAELVVQRYRERYGLS